MSDTQQPAQQTKPKNSPNVRYAVNNIPWFVRIQDLNGLAGEHKLAAHFVKGRSLARGARTAIIVSKTDEENKEAQQVLSKWLNENFVQLRARTVNDKRAQKTQKEGAEGTGADPTSAEPSTTKPATTEPATTDKPATTESASAESTGEKTEIRVPLRFRHLVPRPRSSPKSEANGSAKPESEETKSQANDEVNGEVNGKASSEANGEVKSEEKAVENSGEGKSETEPATSAATTKSKSKRTRTRKSRSKSSAKSSAESASKTTPESTSESTTKSTSESTSESAPASDTTPSETTAPEAGPSTAARKGKGKGGSKSGSRSAPRRVKPRAPTVKVPRNDAVYVRVPGITTTDEIHELLPGFSNVAVKLNHRKGFRGKHRLNSAEAIITVGSENQQKALDVLAGKDVHGRTLEPFPSYAHVRLDSPDTQEAPPAVEQTSVEHVE